MRSRCRLRLGIALMSLGIGLLLKPFLGAAISADFPYPKPPNILFVIMDDVGIDQMQIFGYGGVTPPRTPTIDTVARAGVLFRNTWAMPECSPSRASLFVGRYPLRTGVYDAILNLDLANSQVSPYEVTVPLLLKSRNYESALFGKFHLGGPENNPAGNLAPHVLGWDFFYGYLQGGPYPIDTTAGGVVDPDIDPATCGFIPGSGYGACYFSDGACHEISSLTPGLTCVGEGGIFVPQGICTSPPPAGVNFNLYNAYYVSPLVINYEDGRFEVVPPEDPRAREYRTTVETDAAIDWIKRRKGNKPWMATLSFSAAHAPFQQPPPELLAEPAVATDDLDCENMGAQRVLMNQMVEALDHEVGRLMTETGLATRTADGRLSFHPEKTNTMVLIIGDNGSFAPTVKAPFIPTKSKASVYQTGVWVPLIIAGPLVEGPDREVTHMINVVDLFQLFGEIAGLDVHKEVPKSHTLDSKPVLPYLTHPDQSSLRTSSFTQTADNIRPKGTVISPCVFEQFNTCVQLFTTEKLCTSEQGIWYGPGNVDYPDGLVSCCEVKTTVPGQEDLEILPLSQNAVRDHAYKLVVRELQDCPGTSTSTEFYMINEQAVTPMLDQEDLLGGMGLKGIGALTPAQRSHFETLLSEMYEILNSEPDCPGDGNLDKMVNYEDIQNWVYFSTTGGASSVYDFNFDGLTNDLDLTTIFKNYGKQCWH